VRFGTIMVLEIPTSTVNVTVNGHKTDLLMKLDKNGAAYFEIPDSGNHSAS